ncbi:MAG TPA: hypothetical protein VNX88_18650 [Terriglobales bacterium]|jgi:hypothetical protein|nr:hypothetical protein [Terriglobales bacterium]
MPKKYFVILFVAGLVTVLLAQQQSPTPAPVSAVSTGPHYQLFTAQVQGNDTGRGVTYPPPVQAVFLLNTETGQVWRHQAAFATSNNSSNSTEHPEVFYPVGFAQAQGK